MKQSILIWTILVFWGMNNLCAQEFFNESDPLFTLPKSYIVPFTSSEINIDGKATEDAWRKAQWSDEFADIEGSAKPAPLYDTRFKMLWDEQNLYIFARLDEPHIWAYYDRHDMIVYHENDFEVFIDPDGDTHSYYEFELNARNTLFDLFMDKPYRNGGKPHIKWNAEGFESAVYCNGTLNNPKDADEWWSVEMKIPFAALSTEDNYIQPREGDAWKINFSRVQWQTVVNNGRYERKKDPENGKLIPENNWVWSPQGVINMHYPERWGMAVFSKESTRNQADEMLMQNAALARYLWAVYYKQKQYFRKNETYAGKLTLLGLPQIGSCGETQFELSMAAAQQTFSAKLRTDDGRTFSIDQDGKFEKPTK